ncbi:hypothetical protein GIB67_018049 [Kingdonia uniflora]|uniref:Pentatricopeptide repeat-containing protein n=1 Tax=Kingdonia uniflora TaxID=39325 RepID=A0A7J7NWF0_9MAGN|nr:hypothetical protein GIB67_027854 [Kingdonia uniflora]KAF6171525.1 hypothetical protein GIB67_018049 [Kingdonia uniflora]
MGKLDFGFAGNIFKNGFEQNIVIFNTLLKGLFKENRVKDAIQLFNKITEIGYACNVVTFGTMVRGLCKTGNVDKAFKLFQDMKNGNCKPDIVMYSARLCKDEQINKAMGILV